MFIAYSMPDEMIITTLEDEDRAVKFYFTNGGRNVENYEREEVCTFPSGGFCIQKTDDSIAILQSHHHFI